MGISVALLLLLSAAGCAGEVEVPGMERSLFAMNTYMTFTVYGGEAEEASEEAEQLIQKVEPFGRLQMKTANLPSQSTAAAGR